MKYYNGIGVCMIRYAHNLGAQNLHADAHDFGKNVLIPQLIIPVMLNNNNIISLV